MKQTVLILLVIAVLALASVSCIALRPTQEQFTAVSFANK